MENYYQILGVNYNATQDEIKNAFRNLIKQYHPDVNFSFNAEEMAKKIIGAYDVLSNSAERIKYDSKMKNNQSSYTASSTTSQKTSQQTQYEQQKKQQEAQERYEKWKTESENREREASKSTYHYQQTREESESDFEDWIKEYLRRKREQEKYNLQKIIKVKNDNILNINYNNNLIYKPTKRYDDYPVVDTSDIKVDSQLLHQLEQLLSKKGITISRDINIPHIVIDKKTAPKGIVSTNIPNELLQNPDFMSFKIIYENLVKELTYDREYVRTIVTNKKIESFSDSVNENARRTIVDKKGVCRTFAMRLLFELNQLGIENYLLQQLMPNTIHTLNLYFIGGKPYIADLTDDIVQDHYDYPSPIYKRTTPISYCIDFEEYFKKHNSYLCSVLIETTEEQIGGVYYREIPITEFIRTKYANSEQNENYSGKKLI
ncbi:MAG: DnaJ domain-containing protein [Bacilli bacterium]